ncbi:MAG: DNA-directed RNA polymerase subunit omega [Clostridium sp.]|uniref:DNA-directed RNA polymerase subunit omega n=1 Tax=Clostridium TaxID=1485 RepID=UPI0021529CD6|nr:DNA-directed RNA polymerase subunit omega [Clostridium sp. LY3-2]MCR6515380.1 DNA-directed RNA polymerase subunit omega [Clostridium sp. LY3-2]
MNNSMINPSIVELLEKVDDRYSLVLITSKRARQIIAGSKPLIEKKFQKPLTTAINELNDGVLHFHNVEETTEENL